MKSELIRNFLGVSTCDVTDPYERLSFRKGIQESRGGQNLRIIKLIV